MPNLAQETKYKIPYAFHPKDDFIQVEGPAGPLAISHPEITLPKLEKIFLSLKEGCGTNELKSQYQDLPQEALEDMITHLDEASLLDEAGTPSSRTGLEALLEIEDTINEALHRVLFENVFWKNCQENPQNIPESVLHGMAIENYHFLRREVLFDAPALEYGSSAKVRALVNEFFCEEHKHDELVLRSLKAIGITDQDVEEMLPLPETMALCNALTYWSSWDPLFFFATLGVLEGRDIRTDSFIEVCEARLPEEFTKPIRNHSNINLSHDHGNLSRIIFREIPHLSLATVKRLKAQIPVFVELYDQFYTAVWNHYSENGINVRKLSDLEGGEAHV